MGKMGKNKLYYLINKITYILTKTVARLALPSNEECTPIWITGLFRSGTSVTTNILMHMGVDLGPSQHLLKAKGQRRKLNPDGFFENYLFMDLSLYLFHLTNSWGDQPPSKDRLRNIDITRIDYNAFIRYSLMEVHDDRISNINKLRVLRKYYPANIKTYLNEHFKKPFAVKNPHFAVLTPILKKEWPKSTFLVVFRYPESTISSAQKVTPRADYLLYTAYYKALLDDKNINAIYFSYDHLIHNPRYSIEILAKQFQLTHFEIDKIVSLIHKADCVDPVQEILSHWPNELKEIYAIMLSKAINRV